MTLAVSNGTGTTIEILRSPLVSNSRNAERREIFQAPPDWEAVRGPRMQHIQGDLYIYFYMRIQGDLNGSRMFVIRSTDPCNPLGNWSDPIRLLPEEEVEAHKQSVLQNNNGDLYLIWTGPITNGARYNLFIARMETPTKVVGSKNLLRSPTMEWEWETRGEALNESPKILHRLGAIFLIFTASDIENYCLGIMGIDGGRDPMLLSNWWNDVNHCAFERNDLERVWGTRHASFVNSPDETETWMAYQAYDVLGDLTQTVRIQKVEWEEMNRPKFPMAVGLDKDLEVPSGE